MFSFLKSKRSKIVDFSDDFTSETYANEWSCEIQEEDESALCDVVIQKKAGKVTKARENQQKARENCESRSSCKDTTVFFGNTDKDEKAYLSVTDKEQRTDNICGALIMFLIVLLIIVSILYGVLIKNK